MGKFVIKQTKSGVKFDLKAADDQVIASSQVYKSERTCRAGVASVMANAPEAALEDQTVEEVVKQRHPKFEVYKDKAGEFRFRLKATNGQIIAVSDSFDTMDECLKDVEAVRANAAGAQIEMAAQE